MYICVYVYVCVYVYECMYVCVYMYTYVCVTYQFVLTSSTVSHISCPSYLWFVRWELSGHTAAVLLVVASVAFLYCSLAFSPCVSVEARWYINAH